MQYQKRCMHTLLGQNTFLLLTLALTNAYCHMPFKTRVNKGKRLTVEFSMLEDLVSPLAANSRAEKGLQHACARDAKHTDTSTSSCH
jgi:hypothetical protein